MLVQPLTTLSTQPLTRGLSAPPVPAWAKGDWEVGLDAPSGQAWVDGVVVPYGEAFTPDRDADLSANFDFIDNPDAPVVTAPAGISSGFSAVVQFIPSEHNDNALFAAYHLAGSYYLRVYINDSPTAIQVQTLTSSGLEVNMSSAADVLTLDAINGLALRYFEDDVAFSVNGGAIRQDTSVGLLPSFDNLMVGHFGSLAELNGGLVRLLVTSEQLSDADLIALSTIP